MRNRIIIVTMAMACAALALSQISTGAESRGGGADKHEQEINALKLLGKAGKGKMKNECSSLSAGLATQGIIRKWLEQEDYAPHLHKTARKVAKEGKDCSAQSVYFPIERPTGIEKIKEILGREDSVEAGKVTLKEKNIDLSWYTYGWLQFGVEEGKVTVVQIDFTKSGF